MTGPAQRWAIGDVTVTSVVEVEGPAPGKFLFAMGEPANVLRHEWLRPHFVDEKGFLLSRVQLLMIESEGKRIAVDTCIGNDKQRNIPNWHELKLPFVAWMSEAGFERDTVDTVVCTHLHVDHVGWNTMLVDGQWVPTFPNARYVFNRVEFEHWQAFGVQNDGDVFGDSVKPIFDAGLADLVEPGHRITDEVWVEPTPGHTPGHQSVRILSAGREAVITGDLMHHPIQCAEPDWNSHFDTDPDQARSTRRAFLAGQADRDVLVIGTHFAAPTAGYFRTHEDGTWRMVV